MTVYYVIALAFAGLILILWAMVTDQRAFDKRVRELLKEREKWTST